MNNKLKITIITSILLFLVGCVFPAYVQSGVDALQLAQSQAIDRLEANAYVMVAYTSDYIQTKCTIDPYGFYNFRVVDTVLTVDCQARNSYLDAYPWFADGYPIWLEGRLHWFLNSETGRV